MSAILRSFRPVLYCLFLVFVASSGSVHAQAMGDIYAIDDFNGVNVIVSNPETMGVSVIDTDLLISISCHVRETQSVRIPLQRTVKDQKIRLTIADIENAPSYVGKLETDEQGMTIPYTEEFSYLEYQKGPLHFSLDNKYHGDLYFWFACHGQEKTEKTFVRIQKLELVPLEFVDDRDFVYLLAVLVLLSFVLPGFFAYSVLFEPGEKEKLLVLLTPLSILFFLILYGILALVQKMDLDPGRSILASYVVLNFFLVAWLVVKKRLGRLTSNARLAGLEILAVVIVMIGVAALITKDFELPLHTFTYQRTRYLTYGAFGAHDSMFQFVNGVAIFHDESFHKYYQSYRLLFHVQDRGIIAGVLYAVMRGIAAPINPDIAYSYGFYTLFGAALNSLVLLPVFALHQYFFARKSRPLLILFLLSASPFLVTNYLLTWFKLAGAGVIISGLVILLLGKGGIRPWLVAGALWGLASNFHPSLALSLPVVTIWLLYRFWKLRGKQILPVCFAFVVMMGVFVLMNMPWSVVKATYYEDTSKLFREHFLGSQQYDKDNGLIGTVGQFLDEYTLEEQVSRRLERIQKSLRIEEAKTIIESAVGPEWKENLIRWNRAEAAYSLHVFTVLIVLFAVVSILTRLFPTTSWDPPLTKHRADFRGLLTTQALSIFLVIVISFGKNWGDLTWNMPMSCLVVVLYLLVHCNLAAGKIGAALITAYSLFTYYRLFFQYF